MKVSEMTAKNTPAKFSERDLCDATSLSNGMVVNANDFN